MIVQWHAEKYPPLWRCLYCGETDRETLTNEHIVPFELLPKGGDWFLPKSSCRACADITKRFEGQALRGMFGPLREQLNLKTYRRGAKKRTGRMMLRKNSRDGRIWDEEILVSSFPKLCLGFRWSPPGILTGAPLTNMIENDLVVKADRDTIERCASDIEAFRIATVGPGNFARMLAKIALSYAVAEYGFDAFEVEPLLRPIILGKADTVSHLVGGDPTPVLDQPHALHDVFRTDARLDTGVSYLGVSIRLFAMAGMPRYHVIVGRRLKEAPAAKKVGNTIAVELPVMRR